MASKKPTTLQRMNPMMWKESRNVKKAALTVDESVAGMTKDAAFLESTKPRAPVAVFHRSEICVGRLLGEGSFSQVFEITGIHFSAEAEVSPEEERMRKEIQSVVRLDKEQKKTCRYALKQLKRNLLRKPNDFGTAIVDMVVESKYLSRLDHPNIVKIFGLAIGGTSALDSGRFDSYFLVTDRLIGTLDERIEAWQREGPPNPKMIPRKSNYALQVAHALNYLHQRRILFRDLKPTNVGFSSQHVVKLFDFGLVREIPQGFDHELYAMSGTGNQWYMAIEIFLTGKYNLKADVYSWAMTFYECLTESKPFAKLTKLQHVAAVCVQGKRPKLTQHRIPRPLRALIRSAWEQSVSSRPTICEVIRELEFILLEIAEEDECQWPTKEATPSLEMEAETLTYKDDDSITMLSADDAIDKEIMTEMKKAPQEVKLAEVDDLNFSLSDLIFSAH